MSNGSVLGSQSNGYSKFFYASGRPDDVLKPFMPTVVRVPEQQSDGSVIIKSVVLEELENPLRRLSWTDFTITECLKNGVSYKSLQIGTDLRIGFDSEIDEFNSRVESIASELFNDKN